MKVAVRVQHHPSRAALIPELLGALADFDDVAVVTDNGQPLDTWRAHRACLEATPDDATHLLVIQDDGVPCPQFADKILAAVEAKPNDLIALFAPGFGFIRRRMFDAQRRHEQFTMLPHVAFVPLVAIVYPRAVVERLLAWASGDGWPAASSRTLRGSDDGIVATFTRSSRLEVWATVPCLVEHRDDIASVARPAHRVGAHRRAAFL